MTGLLPSVGIRGDEAERAAAGIRKVRHADVERAVAAIIDSVRREGDAALLRYEKSFDGADLPRLRVADEELSGASASPELAAALRFSLERLKLVQGRLLQAVTLSVAGDGFEVGVSPSPLPSVGCYVPGGRASYASTVLMTAGVAKMAGVGRVVVCSPPGKDGRVGKAVLAAARLCGVDEVYAVGGAQAVAALAYGTEEIKKVAKIVGPGGLYPSVAKRAVAGDVLTDFFAGPTEIVVVAEEGSDAKRAAWDLVGQAEHGEETLCGLVTDSEGFAGEVRAEMEALLPRIERRDYVTGALRAGFAAVYGDAGDACRFVEALAPEHLEILSSEDYFAPRIRSAGLKLLGPDSPCAASDYCMGTDHVIPTGGQAAARGPLSVLDFVKMDWSLSCSREGLGRALGGLKSLAYWEGLPNHYLSVASRFGE
ncbi:MAG: histidinol dehydrogenase [Nitrososphaerota archaeon]|nr:histidinol dehydrogenase [Nitrososphaerota archaeon]MDG6940087.1 histidinol dehydrogenase [Nitrososphaerota archaeon]